MKNILLLLLFTSLYLNAKDKVTLQLNWLHQFQFAGYYVAKEMGYYDDVGIDVEIKEFKYGMNVLKELESKKTDFAIGRSDLLIDKFEKKDVVAIASIFQNSPLVLLVRKDSGINSVKDLVNKNIMMSDDLKRSISLLAMLSSQGLSLKDVFVKEHTFKLQDLINRKTHAMASYISNEPIRLEDLGVEYKMFHPKDYGFRFYSDILFTSSSFIKKNPELTENFFKATIKGWEYAYKNIAKTSELIYRKYNTQDKSLINIVKEAEILKDLAFDSNGKIGTINKSVLKDIVKVYKVFGFIKDDIDYEEFIYKENHPKVYSLEFTQSNLFYFVVIVVLLLLLIGSFIIYVLLKRRWIVTKEKLEEEVLKQKTELLVQNKKLSEIVNSSSEMIVYKDENLKYIGVNDKFAEFVKISKEEIVGKNDLEVFKIEETVNLIQEIDNKVLKLNEKSDRIDWVKVSNRHEKILVHSIVLPYEYEKGKTGVLVFLSDITDLKKMENERVNHQKILLTQSKIAAIGEMLGNIAHQWRQPLAVMTMNLNNIKLDLELDGKVYNEDLEKFIKDSSRQIEYLSKTIDDFRDFFKADSENKTLHSIKKLLKKLEGLIYGSLSHNFIEYIVDIEDDIEIEVNESILIQAFINICNNAKDAFISNNISDNDRFIFVNIKKEENSLTIRFKDSAGGIKEEIIDKVFEPYFTTKHQSLGTGIGLYMTNQIVTKHLGGDIHVSNKDFLYNDKELRGAEFKITIPFK